MFSQIKVNNFNEKLISKKIRVPKRRQRVKEGFSRHFYSEKDVSRNLLGDFQVNESRGKKLIEEIMNKSFKDISLNSLVSVSRIFSNMLNIELTRNIYRRKDLLAKWFDDYQEEIEFGKEYLKIKYINDQ